MPSDPTIPEGLKEHQSSYIVGTWQLYTIAELGWWIHLLSMRALQRTRSRKSLKDLRDAQNYLDIIQAKLDAIRAKFES